jgi:hypothetical protein
VPGTRPDFEPGKPRARPKSPAALAPRLGDLTPITEESQGTAAAAEVLLGLFEQQQDDGAVEREQVDVPRQGSEEVEVR